ncbi:polyprenol monophosphomannose synthase [Spelaeicoccus albus]|uniref:Dolichol-phosphate mannosyltransferase n=1 Tax=Spelaeicoccus albus TaxID=1280376 RepID=A0A7Z0D3W1_9MICO|nr:polyprenol monophosphomannose synthase [Spelaeicoccus albus]NYI68399.1 dolichol-phosphate mannosyltransferase [Spelaeicoccus albus]
MTVPGSRTLVVMPTYNERRSLPTSVTALLDGDREIDILIVDDNSPDGTGRIADSLAADSDRVFVLHRHRKSGLGNAYIAGFRWGLGHDYDVFVEMDADGSHRSEDLPRLLDTITAGADVVLGSRWVPGGRVVNWPRRRQLLSRSANTYVRVAMGIGLHDATAGFRAYRRSVLEALDLDTISSQGYCFQVDMAWLSRLAGFAIAEVPITFVEREYGTSKMTGAIVGEAFVLTTAWAIRQRARQLKSLTSPLRRAANRRRKN